MPEIRVNGTSIHYRIAGSGHPFVFTHGGDLDSSSWDSQVVFFSDRYRVITYDTRGHGRSELPESGYRVDDCVEDLHQLLDHLGVERTYLAGLSMGGYISLSFALTYPHRVAALVLSGTNCGPVVDWLHKRGHEKAARMRAKGTDAAIRYVRAHEANVDRPDLTGRLSEIRVPVLLIVGERDIITPRRISEKMHSEIAGSRLVELPDTGHKCHEEQPQAFNSIVSDFLDEWANPKF